MDIDEARFGNSQAKLVECIKGLKERVPGIGIYPKSFLAFRSFLHRRKKKTAGESEWPVFTLSSGVAKLLLLS